MTSILSTSQISAAAPKGKAAAATPGQEPPAGDFAAMMEEAVGATAPEGVPGAEPTMPTAKAGRAEKRKAAHTRSQSARTEDATNAEGVEKETPEANRTRRSSRGAKAEAARPVASLMDMPIRMPNPPIEGTVTPPAAAENAAPAPVEGAAAMVTGLSGEDAGSGKRPIRLAEIETPSPAQGASVEIEGDGTGALPTNKGGEFATTTAATVPAPQAATSALQPGDATALLRLLADTLGAQLSDGEAPAPAGAVAVPAPRLAPPAALSAPSAAPGALQGTPQTASSLVPTTALGTSGLPVPAASSGVSARGAEAPPVRSGEVVPTAVAPLPEAAAQSAGKREGDNARGGTDSRRSVALSASHGSPSAAATPTFVPTSDSFVVRDASPVLSTSDVGVFLGQQSLDMQIGGHWIDDLSREISSVSAQYGYGSFRLATDRLGEMRVELTPGAQGTDVRMLVDSDSAKAALDAASSDLTQDAQLSAVRIGEVRVDRVAASADARGTDNGGQHQQGQGNQSSSTSGQQAGQGQSQSSRQALDAALSQGNGGNGGSQPKASGSSAVNQDTARGEPSTRADGLDDRRARYA